MVHLDSKHRLQLLGAIHFSALPFYLAMPLPLLLFIAAISLWLIAIIRNNHQLSPLHHKHYNLALLPRVLLVVSSFTLLYFSYGAIFGRQPGITMVILMSLLKMFEITCRRDTHIIIFSSIFVLATHFFQSQHLWLAVYVFVAIIYLMALLVSLSDRKQTTGFSDNLRTSIRLVFAALPFMLILFVLFPRIPGPLWGLPDDAFAANIGISDEMSPGSINQLIGSSDIAFRVKFENKPPAYYRLYWRGAVLADYDGKTWRRDDAPLNAKLNLQSPTGGSAHYQQYTITLEPHNLRWLFSLDYPVQNSNRLSVNREAMLLSDSKVRHITRYSVTSDIHATDRSLFAPEASKYLQLPATKNPETLAFASRLIKQSGYQPQQYINRVLQYFRQQNFSYTLSPPRLGKDAMDDFLFNTRRGFCEHYASAFVTLMRAAGIPARVVVGYMGGEINPVDQYMVVRQSDAHAWAEVWQTDHWQRVDPTAAVSPERIESGIRHAGLEAERLPLFMMSDNALLRQTMFFLDSLQNNWNQWVIGYNQKKQKDLLSTLGLSNTDAANLILWLVVLMTAVGFVVAWLLFRFQPVQLDEIQHYYQILCRKLAKAGLARWHNETATEYQQRLCSEPSCESRLDRTELIFLIQAYRQLHYGRADKIQHREKLKQQFIKKVKKFRVRRQSHHHKLRLTPSDHA